MFFLFNNIPDILIVYLMESKSSKKHTEEIYSEFKERLLVSPYVTSRTHNQLSHCFVSPLHNVVGQRLVVCRRSINILNMQMTMKHNNIVCIQSFKASYNFSLKQDVTTNEIFTFVLVCQLRLFISEMIRTFHFCQLITTFRRVRLITEQSENISTVVKFNSLSKRLRWNLV